MFDINNPIFYNILSPMVLFLFFLLLLVYYKIFRFKKNISRTEEVDFKGKTQITGNLLREYWYWVSEPLIKLFLFIKFTPNKVTILSLFVGIASAITYSQGYFAISGAILVFSATLDTIDGRMARRMNLSSQAGAFLDSVIDRYTDILNFGGIIVYFAIFDPQLKIDYSNSYILVITLFAILGSTLISYSKERGVNLGAGEENSGLMGRPDRIAILTVVSILDPIVDYILLSQKIIEVPRHLAIVFGIGVIALLANRTAVKRSYILWKKLSEKEKK